MGLHYQKQVVLKINIIAPPGCRTVEFMSKILQVLFISAYVWKIIDNFSRVKIRKSGPKLAGLIVANKILAVFHESSTKRIVNELKRGQFVIIITNSSS